MLIFLFGEDIFRARLKLRQIIEQQKKVRGSGLNLIFIDLEEAGELALPEFKNHVRTKEMFSGKKVIILENAFLNAEFVQKFLEYAKTEKNGFEQNIIIFFERGIADAKSPLLAFLKNNAVIQEFKFLTRAGLKTWAKKELAKYSLGADLSAVEKLIDFAGSDLWNLSNEIQKLAGFKNGQKIEVKDIEFLVEPFGSRSELNIFLAIDNLFLGKKTQALKLFRRHLEKGDSPQYLLSMINFQLRNLLFVKDLSERGNSLSEIVRATGLHPFFARKIYLQAKNFSWDKLKGLYRSLFDFDIKTKTGKIIPEMALELLIGEI